MKNNKPHIKVKQRERTHLIEVDMTRSSFRMLVKQGLFELFRPLIVPVMMCISYAKKKVVGIIKIS